MEVTFDMIRSSPEIRTYITQADASLLALLSQLWALRSTPLPM